MAQSRLGIESGLGSGSDIDNSMAAASMLEANLSQSDCRGGSSHSASYSCFLSVEDCRSYVSAMAICGIEWTEEYVTE